MIISLLFVPMASALKPTVDHMVTELRGSSLIGVQLAFGLDKRKIGLGVHMFAVVL